MFKGSGDVKMQISHAASQPYRVTTRNLRRGQKFPFLSGTAAVDDDVKLICKLSRLTDDYRFLMRWRDDQAEEAAQRLCCEL